MLNESILLDIFTSNWPFCVHKLQYVSTITSSEIRECLVCFPTVPSIACEGNTSKIKQKREGNKRGGGKERNTRKTICHYKGLLLRATLSRRNREGKRQVWTFYQDWSEQDGDKKPRAKMYKKRRKFRDKISLPVGQPV